MSVVVYGLDTAGNRWHASGSNEQVGFCSELKGRPWDAEKPKVPIKKLKGRERQMYVKAVSEAADLRRIELVETFGHWLESLPQEQIRIYCEEPLALQNGKTTRMLGQVGGALWTIAMAFARSGERDIEWFWVDVAHWKRVVVGNGNADKDAIKAWVRANLELGSRGHIFDQEDDLYDAEAILQFGLQHLTTGEWPATLK